MDFFPGYIFWADGSMHTFTRCIPVWLLSAISMLTQWKKQTLVEIGCEHALYFSYKEVERNKRLEVKTPAINWWRGKQCVRDCRFKRGKVRGFYLLVHPA